MAKTRYN